MVQLHQLVAGYPEPLPLSAADVVAARPEQQIVDHIVVIDDHPTGSQSMVDVPILAAWSQDQIAWAMDNDRRIFYIVTNTRAMDAKAAENRMLEVTSAVLDAAKERGKSVVFLIRSDSSLRGHFPLDTDIAVNLFENSTAQRVDGVVIVPAFPEAGRITVGGVHYVEQWPGDYVPVAETRFAKEPRFPFTHSDLAGWVAERSRGRFSAQHVTTIPLDVVRTGPEAVAAMLVNVRHGEPIVVDAVVEEDLRSVAIGLHLARAEGKRFVCRSAPPFVRALVGQEIARPLSVEDIQAIQAESEIPEGPGLIVVGTPNPLTRRQVRALEARRPIREVSIAAPALLDSRREGHVEQVIQSAVDGLAHGNVMVRLAQMEVDTEAKGDFSLDPRIGRAINEICYQIAKRAKLSFVVARGGSVVQYVAQALGVRRSIVRGPMLDGIVSLWQPLVGQIAGVPFVVYAGGVGNDESLADVVDLLSGIVPPERLVGKSAENAPQNVTRLAVLGLGSRGMPIARRLAETFPVDVYDVDPAVRIKASHENLSVALSARDAARESQCVIIAVRGAEVLDDVLNGTEGIAEVLEPGAVVMVVTAVGVEEIRLASEQLARKGVHLVDAPVTGGHHQALAGGLLATVGGTPHAVEAVRHVLERIADPIVPAGNSAGDGQAMKAVNQLLAAVNLAGVAEAMTLGTALGLEPAALEKALGAGSASSFMLSDRGPRMRDVIEGATPQAENRLAVTTDELAVALEIARESAISTPVAAAAEQEMMRASLQLPDESDDSELIRVVSPKLL